MQGKLVPQIPSEGTAEELYAQIQEEKQKLIAEGKLKKEKPLPPITKDEIPFQIPPTWKWVRVKDVFALINGDRGKNYPSKEKLSNSGIPFISAINLDGEKVVVDDSLKYMTHKQYDKLNSGKLNNNDVIVCIRGSLGKHAVFHLCKGAIASSLVILRLIHNQETLTKWMLLYLDSLVFNDEIKKYDNGTAQPNLSASNFKKFLFPVPCLNEQKRICSKIDLIEAEIKWLDKVLVC